MSSAPDPQVYAAPLQFAGATVVALADGEALPDVAGGLLVVGGGTEQENRRQQLAAWAAAHELSVVADETSAPLDDYTPFASLPGMAARTLTLGSFDGAPGLGAWQVSWFAGPKPLLTSVRDLKQSITICTSAPSQYAALAALKEYTAAAQATSGAKP